MKDIMEEIRIITNKGELEGTCYIEVLPGPYREQCWNEGSLFVTVPGVSEEMRIEGKKIAKVG
jgi:hypothetical protein